MAKLVMLIETEDRRGRGATDDPVRLVKQWFTVEGQLVVEHDPWLSESVDLSQQPNSRVLACGCRDNGSFCVRPDHGQVAHA